MQRTTFCCGIFLHPHQCPARWLPGTPLCRWGTEALSSRVPLLNKHPGNVSSPPGKLPGLWGPSPALASGQTSYTPPTTDLTLVIQT